MRRRAEATCLACSMLALATLAHGAHPFITDDAYTQGTGKFELQLGSQYTRTNVDGVTLADLQFAPQLSYGVAGPIDLILRPTYSVNVASGGASGRSSGWGDTNFEVKWRFWQRDPWILGLTAGTSVPSGNFNRGLDSGRSTPRAYLLAGYTAAPVEFWTNIGAIRNTDDPAARTWLEHVSANVLWTVREGLRLGLDLAADQNPLRASTQWPSVALVGAIYTVRRGWDVDAGYQRGLNHSAPRDQILVGATFRW
jgi:hypothetical protein